MRLPPRVVPVVACALFAAGCGESIQQKTYPVSGRVTLNGKAAAGVTVVFHATDTSKFKWEELPQGKTGADGNFTLFTYAPGDGAPAAAYKVAVEFAAAADDADGGDQVKRTRPSVRIPDKYMNPNTSGLMATVEAKSANDLPTFELNSAGK